ncbi:hypothetical protein NLG97_g5020 [Lecanicillium saksenae]|uniref:Uncharacterized protein n=1 Tax=Lecanicillium saksenae TaxID=468837 RepID=A0ACC1QUY5_9HYPO|nr:hypothetical protein NLG97_g5020 [Lecanicillium saksenae]
MKQAFLAVLPTITYANFVKKATLIISLPLGCLCSFCLPPEARILPCPLGSLLPPPRSGVLSCDKAAQFWQRTDDKLQTVSRETNTVKGSYKDLFLPLLSDAQSPFVSSFRVVCAFVMTSTLPEPSLRRRGPAPKAPSPSCADAVPAAAAPLPAKLDLMSLPTEIHLAISHHLTYPDALSLKHTNAHFRSLNVADYIWSVQTATNATWVAICDFAAAVFLCLCDAAECTLSVNPALAWDVSYTAQTNVYTNQSSLTAGAIGLEEALLSSYAQQIADFDDRPQVIITPRQLHRYQFSNHSFSGRPFREELMRHLEQERGWFARSPSPSSASSYSSPREFEAFQTDDIFQDILRTPAALPAPAELVVLAEPAMATGAAVLPTDSCTRCKFLPDQEVRQTIRLKRSQRPQLQRTECSTAQSDGEKTQIGHAA